MFTRIIEAELRGCKNVVLVAKYLRYKNALEVIKLNSIEERREKLCLRLAKLKQMF